MISLAEKQKIRHAYERKLHLINEMQKLGHLKMEDGRSFEECTLYSLEYEHARIKSEIGKTL